ncbi:MAG: sugar phosphate isomerase/epimerase [Spirochaetaceae bacterium]|jgi:sugar phosphate isomerase/epimerase|nr:sugar phosphate isomerase/epimerase [Spirochaetaceae bacterium]
MYLATQDKPFFPAEFQAKFAAVKALGFDAFEIGGRVLLDKRTEVEKASASAGLPISTVCGGYTGWIGDFSEEKRRNCLKEIREILSACGSFGITGIVLPAAWGMFSLRLPPMTPPRNAKDDRNVLLDSLSFLDAAAGETGTYIYLEPLNRYENHMILRVEDAVSLIREGGFSRVKITADFFHMNIEEACITETLSRFASYIGHIHLASSQRLEPGTGHLDYLPGFTALYERGYRDGFCFECRVQTENPSAAYARSLLYIREVLKKAGYV